MSRRVINIGICDDEEKTGSQLERILLGIGRKLNIKFEIDIYFSGESLLKNLYSGICYDLIFLDIELSKKMNGVEVGAIIRDEYKDELIQIVYISGKPQYALELFGNNPLDFLLKPLLFEKTEKVIKRFLKISGFWSGVFTYKYGSDTYKVQLKDILYLESKGKKVLLHMKEDSYDEFYGSLNRAFDEQLKKHDFLFIHKTYIVNYEHIIAFEYEQLTLSNKIVLPIGQSKRKSIRIAQMEIEKRRL